MPIFLCPIATMKTFMGLIWRIKRDVDLVEIDENIDLNDQDLLEIENEITERKGIILYWHTSVAG